jgi:hypothetical protein
MNERFTIDCGPPDDSGKRLVVALCKGLEHRDRFQTDNAFLRQKFTIAALIKFGWVIEPEILVEIDAKLLAVADAEDARSERATAVSADLVRLCDVPPSDVDWLWPGRVALGKLTLLSGDPGLGKSFLTLDMAARVSRGASWPGENGGASLRDPDANSDETCRRAGSVILLSAEDDLGDTIRPRLEAHGADCTRIAAIRAIAGSDGNGRYRRAFDLARDLVHLAAELDRMPDCRLIVVDPISAYLGRSAENVNAEVRGLLSPLATLATERHLAVVVVTHLRKGEGATLHRSMGSMAFVAAARSAWVVCRDPHAPHRRLMLPVKNNLASDTSGLAYTIEPLGPGGAAVVCWSAETVTMPADEAMAAPPTTGERGPAERREVAAWLKEFLAAGSQTASEVRAAAEAHGFSYATLRRAFRELGGEATREGQGVPANWTWRLPPGAAVA